MQCPRLWHRFSADKWNSGVLFEAAGNDQALVKPLDAVMAWSDEGNSMPTLYRNWTVVSERPSISQKIVVRVRTHRFGSG